MYIKLFFYPHFIKEVLDSGCLQLHELDDIDRLQHILSEIDVSKISYLNNRPDDDLNDRLNLTIFDGYMPTFKEVSVDINESNITNKDKLHSGDDYKPRYKEIPYISPIVSIPNVLYSLSRTGFEGMIDGILDNINSFYLGYTGVRIRYGVYGIIFKEMEYFEGVENIMKEKYEKSIINMDGLLTLISKDIGDKRLIKEPIFQQYLKMFK
jgi:hypothetical protein